MIGAALRRGQDASGGWGQQAGGVPTTEATALALLALASGAGVKDASARAALAWLNARQHPDGSWPATDQVSTPSWMTVDALLVFSLLGIEEERRRRAARWLLERRSAGSTWITRLIERYHELRDGEKQNVLDPSLVGWPWTSGAFGWVEPTATAVLALRAAAARDRSIAGDARYAERIRMGERLLVDRAVPGGGWNAGNVRVLGADLDPYPDTTAWALLALRDPSGRPIPGASAVANAGLDRLDRMLRSTRSMLAHALAAITFRAYGRDDAFPLAVLKARALDRAAVWVDNRSRALALLALGAGSRSIGGLT